MFCLRATVNARVPERSDKGKRLRRFKCLRAVQRRRLCRFRRAPDAIPYRYAGSILINLVLGRGRMFLPVRERAEARAAIN